MPAADPRVPGSTSRNTSGGNMRSTPARPTLAGIVIMSSLGIASSASAASGDPCAALTDEDNAVPTLYVENGDTQEQLVKRLGRLLMQSANKVRLVYRNRPTCNIRNDIFAGA